MIKYIGIFLLSLSVSILGTLLSERQRCADKKRNEILELIKEIHRGIKYGKKDLFSTYSAFQSVQLKKCGFLTAIKSGRDIEQAIYENLSELSTNEKQAIFNFFSTIGKSPHSQKELEICAQYIDLMEEQNKKAQKEGAAKQNLYKKLGLILAIMLAIILI